MHHRSVDSALRLCSANKPTVHFPPTSASITYLLQHLASSSWSVSAHCLLDLFPANRTHPQSFCTFQTTADVAAWYEDHVRFSVQTNLKNIKVLMNSVAGHKTVVRKLAYRPCTGADPGRGDCPRYNLPQWLFNQYFLQFGKQHSRYKAMVCRPLFCHNSVVKFPYLSCSSEPVVRLHYQILLKSPPHFTGWMRTCPSSVQRYVNTFVFAMARLSSKFLLNRAINYKKKT